MQHPLHREEERLCCLKVQGQQDSSASDGNNESSLIEDEFVSERGMMEASRYSKSWGTVDLSVASPIKEC